MKKILYCIISLAIMTLFSGCVVATGTYQPEYTSKELNPYYSKVSNTNVSVIEDNSIFIKTPETMNGGLGKVNLKSGEINNQITKSFFEEYFSNVKFEKTFSNKGLEIQSTIVDFKYYLVGMGNDSIYVKVNIIVLNNGKKILDKNYIIEESSKILLRVWVVNGRETVIELFHKALLDLYEREIKKDLLEAL